MEYFYNVFINVFKYQPFGGMDFQWRDNKNILFLVYNINKKMDLE